MSIPSLTHGQMTVVEDHRGAILALANEQVWTDLTFRRLRNFIALQRAFCLWGVMPGSVTDEASPFNECSHAELAAARALLQHMIDMPASASAARQLDDTVDRAMLASGIAPVLCRFSDEPFNTADVMRPHWRDVPFHLPTALTLLSALIAVVLGTVVARAAAQSCGKTVEGPVSLTAVQGT